MSIVKSIFIKTFSFVAAEFALFAMLDATIVFLIKRQQVITISTQIFPISLEKVLIRHRYFTLSWFRLP